MAPDFSTILCDRPECRLFSKANARSDTIKVDFTRLEKEQPFSEFYKEVLVDDTCKENALPAKQRSLPAAPEKLPLEVATFQAALKEREHQEQQREALRSQEEQRQREEDEARSLREEAYRLECEQLELERLEAEHQALLEICDRQRREAEAAAEEQRRRAEALEAERREHEAQAAEEAEQRKVREQEEAKAEQEHLAVEKFLSNRGYSGVNSRRSKLFKYKYPLHSAVKDNSLEMVELLLGAKADPMLKNSSGLTPGHLAMKLSSRHGSHDDVLCALQRICSKP